MTIKTARAIAWAVFFGSIATSFIAPQVWDMVASMLWVGSVIALLAIRAREKVRSGVVQKPDRGMWFVAITALILALVDALFFGQGVLALALCLAGFIYYLPRAIGAYPDRRLFRVRAVKAAVTVVAGSAAIATIVIVNAIAEDRAKEVIAAVEAYKASAGGYPARLEQLVPAYLPEVPHAKPAGMMRTFDYYASDAGHTLMYTVTPPFGRKLYHFEKQRWSALD
jgi:hypothetical protein